MVVSVCSVTAISYPFADTSGRLLRLSPNNCTTDVSIWASGQLGNISPTSFTPFFEVFTHTTYGRLKSSEALDMPLHHQSCKVVPRILYVLYAVMPKRLDTSIHHTVTGMFSPPLNTYIQEW